MKAMDREWREAADLRPSRVGLALALLAAAMLRFWALPHGVPYALGVDEPEVMERAVRMMQTGDFNPHFFDYPSLYMYVQAVGGGRRASCSARCAASGRRWPGARPTDFYLWGRAVTAILGTATVFAASTMAGMRWGARTALLAAALLAVMPLHVRESHYVLTDVPVTFFVMLTLSAVAARARARDARGRSRRRRRGRAGRRDQIQRRARDADAAPRLLDDACRRSPSRLVAVAGDPRRPASARSCSPRPTRSSICRPS